MKDTKNIKSKKENSSISSMMLRLRWDKLSNILPKFFPSTFYREVDTNKEHKNLSLRKINELKWQVILLSMETDERGKDIQK